MYPKNAATPPVIDLGEIVLKADGTQQTSGASARVKIGAGAWGASAGTLACDATSGIWTYAPTQAETNADFFIVAAYKADCTSVSKTVVTTASATPGKVVLSGETHTSAVIPTVSAVSGAVGSVTATVNSNVVSVNGGLVDTDPATPDVNVVSMAADSISAAAVSSAAVTKVQTGLATSTQVTSLLANTRANIVCPSEMEVPDSSTSSHIIRIYLMDSDGAMEAPDSTPTVTLINAAGTSRASRLASATNPATGVYEWVYTNTAGDTQETLYGEITVTEGGVPRKYPFQTQLVEFTAYRFSSTDRTALEGLVTNINTVITRLGVPNTSIAQDVIEGATHASDASDGIAAITSQNDDVLAYIGVVRAFLLNKHTAATESPTGTYTWIVRNDADSADYLQVVYVKATGARTVTVL